MRILSCLALAVFISGCTFARNPDHGPLASDAEIAEGETAPLSGQWAAMNQPYAPFNIMGDLYYVGASDVTSFLIVTPQGDILLDGGFAETAPMIEAHIAQLGFNIRDVKFLLSSHAHIDHAGGLARLQRDSGAVFVASAGDKPTLEAGVISYGPTAGMHYPPIRVDRVVGEGDTVTLGGVTLTAHMTPGHTAGCTSWSMPVTDAHGAQHVAFFTCSETVAGQSLVPPAYPHMIEDYRATFARVRTIEADVFLGPHGSFFDLAGKRQRQIAGDANAFVDPEALQHFNTDMEQAFNTELARQQRTRG
ncbi:MAG: subclass B3 metallo-beta-lactamase [Pseudomonadota bacterium]